MTHTYWNRSSLRFPSVLRAGRTSLRKSTTSTCGVWVPKASIPNPAEPGSLPTGLVNRDLCRRVGIQPLVTNRHPATDRQTVLPIPEPLLSTVQRRQPIAQARCNRIVNPLSGQRLRPVVCVTLLILSRTVLLTRCLAIRQHPLDLDSFGPQALSCCVHVH